MKRDEILAMKPGLELDAFVAEKVMGWEYLNTPGCLPIWRNEKGAFAVNPHPHSTDISAALEAQQKVMNDGHPQKCNFIRSLADVVGAELESRTLYEVGLLLQATPEQRCKAALVAVMG